MIQKKRKKNQFGMFKAFKLILKSYNSHILNFFHYKADRYDLICFFNLIQLQIFDYIIYKLFKKYTNYYHFFKNNFITNSLVYLYRFNLNTGDMLCIGSFNKSKFYWTNFSYNPIKFFNLTKNNFKSVNLSIKTNRFEKIDVINTLINTKKQLGFLKKKDRSTYNILVNSNAVKNFKYHNVNFNTNKSVDFSKMFDLKRKTLKTFVMNRLILKNNFFLTTSRQSKLTKFFSKNSNISVRQCILNFENSLPSLLIKSKLVFTFNDATFLIKNNFVYVNGVICNKTLTVLKNFDIVNLVFTEKYFKFYKTLFNTNLKLSSFLSYRLWRYNRFRANFYKQSPTSLPTWINKINFFYYDVPTYLEVDYVTLSFVLLKSSCFNSFYVSKNINVFLFRLYNWKYVN